MGKQRRDDQAVDAFSAPKELLLAAREMAHEMRMTKSGLYRYAIAKVLRHMYKTEEDCLRVAEHASLQRIYNKQQDQIEASRESLRAVSYNKSKSKKTKRTSSDGNATN